MTINPDAPIPSEQHPELYERMCNARAFIEQVLAAYVKARKANGMTKPDVTEIGWLQVQLDDDVAVQFNIANGQCAQTLGEEYQLNDQELEQLIKENWNGK